VCAAQQQLEGPAKKAAAEFIAKLTGSAPAAAAPGPPPPARSGASLASAAAGGLGKSQQLLRTSTAASLRTAPAGNKSAALATKSTSSIRTGAGLLSRSASTVGAGAAPADGPLLSLDSRKEDRAKKVGGGPGAGAPSCGGSSAGHCVGVSGGGGRKLSRP
jgi:hypothetical protein